ncbi:hypothetical protein A2U01_0090960, partial [Trifolium medium]|nr:hypothetical protein [Trifolium medium]
EQTEKSDVDKVVAETLVSQNPKYVETLDTSRSVAEGVVDVTISPSATANEQIDVSEKVSTRPIDNSVKENTTTPNVEPDVG